MLGRHKNWVKAKGRVIAVDRHHTTDGNRPVFYDSGYVIEVHPADGVPFRAEVDPAGHHIGHFSIDSPDFKNPNEGDTVSVEYDSASKRVRFDMSDPALHEKASRDAETAAAHARFEQALETASGSDTPSGPEFASDDPELQELLDLEDSERSQRTDT